MNLPVRIWIFRRKDGTHWAEFSEKCARRQGEIMNMLEACSRAELEELTRAPQKWAQERVQALADRALDEHVASLKAHVPAPKKQVYRAPEPPVVAPISQPAPVAKPGFFNSLRWLLRMS